MRQLTLADLKVALADLLDKRRTDILLSRAGQYYLPDLQEVQARFEDLPPTLLATPLADRLAEIDDTHDGYGRSIFFFTEAYRRMPRLSPEVRQAADRIRAALIPSLDELNASYVVEADRAVERRPKLAALEADLKRFPMAEAGTLFEVASRFVDAGVMLKDLLSERADVTARNRRDASTLRSKTLGLLGRLREDLAKEVARKDTTLPANLDARVFGFIDLLATESAARAAQRNGGSDAGKGQGQGDDTGKPQGEGRSST